MTTTATKPAAARPSLLLILTISVSGITTNTLVTAGLPDLLDGVGASRDLAGLVVAAGSLPGIVLATVMGLLSDRYGRREVIVPCLVTFGIAGGMASLATSLWEVVLWRLVQGMGSAGLVNLAAVLISDHWRGDDERAHVLGLNAGVLTLCLAAFPVLGGWLTDIGGWQAPFRVYPLALITAAVIWRRLPPSGPPTLPGRLRDQFREAWPELTTRRHVAALVAILMVFVLIFGMMLTQLPLLADEEFGLGASARGVVLGAPALGSSLAAFTVARFSRRFGTRRVITVSALLFATALAVMATASVLPVLVAGTLLFGLAEGSAFPTLQNAIASAASDAHRGTLMASQVSAARLGQTVGPLLSSATSATTGSRRLTLGLGSALAVVVMLPAARRAVTALHDADHPDADHPDADRSDAGRVDRAGSG